MAICAVSTQAQATAMQFYEHEEAANNRSGDRPQINPSPRRVLVLQGRKDPNLEIWFVSLYGTTKLECQAQTLPGRLTGAPDVLQAIYDSIRVPTGNATFSVRFFLDRYLPGHCDWQPMGVLYSAFDPSTSTGPTSRSGMVTIRPNGQQRAELAYICRRMTKSPSSGETPRIVCQPAKHFSNDATTMSSEGGVIELEYRLEPEHHE
jgi:hypothetical protein